MANEIRLRANNISGTITDNPLTNVATVINSPGFVDLPTVDTTSHLILILDPLELAGPAEIVTVTAHSAAASSVTVVRGAEGSAARTHSSGTTWFHGPVVSDFGVGDPARASAQRLAAQSITNAAWNLVTFDTEMTDTENMFTVGTGDRFTIRSAGRYDVKFTASFASNATGLRGWAIAKGVSVGVGFFAEILSSVATTGGHVNTIASEFVFAAGDTVSCQVFQNSGGALNLTGGNAGVTSEPNYASIRKVATS